MAEFPDVPVSDHVVEGPGGPALLSQADRATLLVVGAQGRRLSGHAARIGAEYCVRNGACPVVVVRIPAPRPALTRALSVALGGRR